MATLKDTPNNCFSNSKACHKSPIMKYLLFCFPQKCEKLVQRLMPGHKRIQKMLKNKQLYEIIFYLIQENIDIHLPVRY